MMMIMTTRIVRAGGDGIRRGRRMPDIQPSLPPPPPPQHQPPQHQHQQRRHMARNRSKRRNSFIVLEDHELSPRHTKMPVPVYNHTRKTNHQKIYPMVQTPQQLREEEIYQTEQMIERLHATIPEPMGTYHTMQYYCIKQHLWYRATPMYDHDDDDEPDDSSDDDNHNHHHQKRPVNFNIDIGLTPRSVDSIGDVLCITLFNNRQKEGGPKLPELNARRDHIEPYKKNMKTSLPFEEGELLFAIIWEGIEEDKSDHEFYLVTGRNIWRSPIRGIATLNMKYIHRNWTTHPPTAETVLLSIVCTRDDYYYKISHMYDGPIIIPDVENSTYGPNRQKKRIDRSRTMDMDNDSLEEYCHKWVTPDDYHTFMEANPPIYDDK